ncbi:MAG: penicillin-binding protein activator LpoB [Deltaproteobacteria bacterium]|nr:penicillin-binding protein activator LpoB [Deltaproteobacteria bacterium]MBK8240022.1 penicillin-binding protein activator LpoB [Deltaproteobacteria bacterium]MBK8715987.1 penicillin-binding protein activator LpoB [Deltaproteobacteria bacterium]MBP7289902.1 penicillin-binding protein activator LpoB [Nannocystaceae bacterium]
MHRARRSHLALLLSSLLLPTLVGGCKTKAIRGGEGTENPDLDEGAMSTGLDRKDLDDLMKKNIASLMASPLWGQWRTSQQPVVAIWPIKNDTSEHLDDQMLTLLSDMETELINSGVVAVVSRERQAEMIAEANLQQTADFNPALAAQIGRQIGAQYFVTGKLQAVDERMNKERRVQYTLFMQVIEVETSVVKFQTKSERSKAIIR